MLLVCRPVSPWVCLRLVVMLPVRPSGRLVEIRLVWCPVPMRLMTSPDICLPIQVPPRCRDGVRVPSPMRVPVSVPVRMRPPSDRKGFRGSAGMRGRLRVSSRTRLWRMILVRRCPLLCMSGRWESWE